MKTIKRRTVLQVASSTAALGLLTAARAADTADKAARDRGGRAPIYRVRLLAAHLDPRREQASGTLAGE